MKTEIVYLSIKKVKLNPDNPRQIGTKEFTSLVKSLKDCPNMFEARPLLVSNRTGENIVLGGNMRLRAAQKLGYKEVPVIILPGLTDAQEKEITIKDNGAWGEWDYDALANAWGDLPLKEWGVDIPDDWASDQVEPADAEPQIDKAAELNKKWKVKTGDLFRIGDHRLLCGDSTKREDVERVMGGGKAALFFTDPPYGVNYSEKNEFLNAANKGNRNQTPIEGDNKTPDEMFLFWRSAWSASMPSMETFCSYYITGPQGGDLLLLLLSLREEGWTLKHMLIWAKNNHVLGRCDYHYKHEPIIYGWLKSHKFYGDASNVSLWEIDKPHSSESHPTMKPIELMAKGISNSTKKNDVVLDPFLGSGTTMVACQNLSRKCRGIEISPNYCAVILERMQAAFPDIEIERVRNK